MPLEDPENKITLKQKKKAKTAATRSSKITLHNRFDPLIGSVGARYWWRACEAAMDEARWRGRRRPRQCRAEG
jgi:hypothetical protein